MVAPVHRRHMRRRGRSHTSAGIGDPPNSHSRPIHHHSYGADPHARRLRPATARPTSPAQRQELSPMTSPSADPSTSPSPDPDLATAPQPPPRRTGTRNVGPIVAGSLTAGLIAAGLLVAAPFVGTGENTVTGAVLLAFALGWALLAVLSTRWSDQPQRWAAAPAAFMALAGMVLLLAPDAIAHRVLDWVWPPALLALLVWIVLRTRRQLHSRTRRWLLYPAPTEASASTASTGYSSHRRVRLCNCRRVRRTIQTRRASSAGGHTQSSTRCAMASGARSSTIPASAMNAAGAAAHRWGWSLHRVDSTASSAQPRANASSTAPVTVFSPVPTNGAATSSPAAMSPAVNDPATIGPTLRVPVRRGGGCGAVARSGSGEGLVEGSADGLVMGDNSCRWAGDVGLAVAGRSRRA